VRAVAPGISTWELDRIARAGIKREGVTSAFLGYASPPYPAVTCISVNEEIVHGIPRKVDDPAEGDIIGIDFGMFKHDLLRRLGPDRDRRSGQPRTRSSW
jgi:methionyl aminopeptidase